MRFGWDSVGNRKLNIKKLRIRNWPKRKSDIFEWDFIGKKWKN
jgi:5-methylcytosine-specific restriction endonuclease McrBC GTP-binding regulatory subunit McrB